MFIRTKLRTAIASAVALWAMGWMGLAAADPIVVLTSYPEELTTAYEKAYEQAHPGADVQILWQRGRDAMATLSKPDRGGVDVYWAPAMFNFPTLAKQGVFAKLAVDRKEIPGWIGAQQVSDPNGYFEAFEVAGYGIAANSSLLESRDVARPRTWEDLARPQYSGLVVMPIASGIGYAPQLYDVVVQGEGWEKGWALLSEMAGNATLTGKGAEIVDTVADGKAGAAIAIDFLVRDAISDGKPVSLIYPKGTAFLPAYVAVVASSRHSQDARSFADFVLSKQGQKLLFAPGGARYPIRPDVYADAPKGTVNPFALPAGSTFAYDLTLGPSRGPLISAVFESAIASRGDQLKTLWTAIHRAEAKAKDASSKAKVAEARALAGWVPVTTAESADAAYIRQFEPQGREPGPAAKSLMTAWRTQIDEKQSRALRLAQDVLAEK